MKVSLTHLPKNEMNVTQLIKDLNDELLKYATSKNQDTCQRIIMNEGKIHIEDRPVVYGDFQVIPKHKGGRIYPRDQYWNCLDPVRPHPNPSTEHFLKTKGV